MKPSPASNPPIRPFRPHPQMDAQLVRLRSGQHLKHGQQAVEAGAGNPALLLHQLAPDHGDLGDGAAEGEQAEAQEAKEQRRMAEIGRGGFGRRHCMAPFRATGAR
jgi:hypothetical protein